MRTEHEDSGVIESRIKHVRQTEWEANNVWWRRCGVLCSAHWIYSITQIKFVYYKCVAFGSLSFFICQPVWFSQRSSAMSSLRLHTNCRHSYDKFCPICKANRLRRSSVSSVFSISFCKNASLPRETFSLCGTPARVTWARPTKQMRKNTGPISECYLIKCVNTVAQSWRGNEPALRLCVMWIFDLKSGLLVLSTIVCARSLYPVNVCVKIPTYIHFANHP